MKESKVDGICSTAHIGAMDMLLPQSHMTALGLALRTKCIQRLQRKFALTTQKPSAQ